MHHVLVNRWWVWVWCAFNSCSVCRRKSSKERKLQWRHDNKGFAGYSWCGTAKLSFTLRIEQNGFHDIHSLWNVGKCEKVTLNQTSEYTELLVLELLNINYGNEKLKKNIKYAPQEWWFVMPPKFWRYKVDLNVQPSTCLLSSIAIKSSFRSCKQLEK